MTNPNMVLYSHLFGNPAPLPKEYFPLMDRWWKIELEDSRIFTTNTSFSLVVSECCHLAAATPYLAAVSPHPAPATQLCQLYNNITKCWEQDAVYPLYPHCIPHHTTSPSQQWVCFTHPQPSYK